LTSTLWLGLVKGVWMEAVAKACLAGPREWRQAGIDC